MYLSMATREATRFACGHFHYSGSTPVIKYGFNVFNDSGEWCGVILYGPGANGHIASPYGLWQGEVLELIRVALNGKQETTSQCLAASLKELHRIDPIVKMVVSYADIDQDHIGTIYQATNWIYEGVVNKNTRSAFIIHGKKMHPKTCHSYGWKQSLPWLQENIDPNADVFISRGKHKYLYAFDKKVRKQLLTRAKPYPKSLN